MSEKRDKLIWILLIWMITLNQLMAQQRDGVIISDDPSDKPSESAMLEVKSIKKGLLIPRVLYNAISTNSIQPPADGLIVFVTDNKPGYYYYDAKAKGWKKLRPAKDSDSEMSSPTGSIIMYYGGITDFDDMGIGKKGTQMEGWVLCNGKNGAPDLSGKFVVGAGKSKPAGYPQGYPGELFPADYQEVGKSEKKDNTYTLNIAQMPAHSHTVNSSMLIVNIKHSHDLEEGTTKDEKTGDDFSGHASNYTTRANTNHGTGGDFRRRNSKRGSDDTRKTSVTKPSVSLGNAQALLGFTTTANIVPSHEVDGSDGFNTIDNRPAFFVLYYIMKVDPKDLEEIKNRTFQYPIND